MMENTSLKNTTALSSPLKLTLLTGMGIGMEYYDFVLFGMLAPTLSSLFFPSHVESLRLIQTFLIFAIGYFARPLAAILFGALSDRFGRKITFLTAMLMMAISTFCIGILPTYQTIGSAAPLLLLFFRLVQGLSFGAELPSGVTFLSEHLHEKKHGVYLAVMTAHLSLGALIASFLIFLISNALSQKAWLMWGWRIPFLLGGTLALIIYFIRKNFSETPLFAQQNDAPKKLHEPIKELIKHYPFSFFKALGLLIFSSSFVVFLLTAPAFLNTYFNYPLPQIYEAITVGLIWSIFLFFLIGPICDRIGPIRLMSITLALSIIGVWILFKILAYKTQWALFTFILGTETILTSLHVGYMILLPALFPTRIRTTGVGVSYNIAFCFAGVMPSFIIGTVTYFNHPMNAAYLFVLLAILSFFSVKRIQASTDLSLRH